MGEKLREELHQRLSVAGMEVDEARISSLAYAPEIAAVILRRQQAAAAIAACAKIVEGAVGMVEMALSRLEEKGLMKASEQERAHGEQPAGGAVRGAERSAGGGCGVSSRHGD